MHHIEYDRGGPRQRKNGKQPTEVRVQREIHDAHQRQGERAQGHENERCTPRVRRHDDPVKVRDEHPGTGHEATHDGKYLAKPVAQSGCDGMERLRVNTHKADVFGQKRWAHEDEVEPETDEPEAA